MTPTNRIDPARAVDFTPEWLAERRRLIIEGNYTVRPSARRCSIELTNAACAGGTAWYFLTLPGDTTLFASEQDRAEILGILTGANVGDQPRAGSAATPKEKNTI